MTPVRLKLTYVKNKSLISVPSLSRCAIKEETIAMNRDWVYSHADYRMISMFLSIFFATFDYLF